MEENKTGVEGSERLRQKGEQNGFLYEGLNGVDAFLKSNGSKLISI